MLGLVMCDVAAEVVSHPGAVRGRRCSSVPTLAAHFVLYDDDCRRSIVVEFDVGVVVSRQADGSLFGAM